VNDVAPAASVLLARGPGSQELFVVRRADTLRFLGGFQAFPGGKVAPGDADLAPGASLAAQRGGAVRELFEETGVLLARRAEGTFPSADAALVQARADLLADKLNFADLLSRHALRLRPDDLVPAGSLLTPSFSPIRFDTAFFVATLPPGQTAEVWPGELTEGAWHTADDLLRHWTAGSHLVSPPTISLLEVLRGRPIAELPERLRPLLDALAAGGIPDIWFNPGVLLIPLFCQGLPPSTHTNAYLVGTGPVYLLDPGPTDHVEQERLFAVLDRRAAEGQRLSAVVLTHHHPDHIGAVAACARRYGVPVLAHPATAAALRGKVEVQRELHDGERLDLGRLPSGGDDWHLEAVHTPGHARGHLAFYEPHYRLLFAGDMVSTLSSVVIVPPEGDLAEYIASLRRLQTYPARLLLPAHGPVSARPAFTLAECLEHRRKREEQLLQMLGAAPRLIPDLAREIYRGLPANLLRLAELQVLAGLQKLQREGQVIEVPTADGTAWQRPQERA
jgi:glyoxylase-like metal-dependent hydrolase (beta-lactamase superfamily II)/8-oxo-dGTP pyrophosphatase MutT (NUDIX family)